MSDGIQDPKIGEGVNGMTSLTLIYLRAKNFLVKNVGGVNIFFVYLNMLRKSRKKSEEKILETKIEKASKPKICRHCKELTPYEDLVLRGYVYVGTDIRSTINVCKKCHNKAREEQRKRNPKSELRKQTDKKKSQGYIKKHTNKLKEKRLKERYGKDLSWYYETLIEQEFKCKICELEITEKTARVDHCHTHLNVRGLLCNSCNLGLGSFKDNTTYLEQAIKYLQENTHVQ